MASFWSMDPLVIICAMEGPDAYALAGGLGTRVSELARALAGEGVETHLFFVGDPGAPGEESPAPRLTLHRWSQWLSRYYPLGVYHGEEDKIRDIEGSLPEYLVDGPLGAAVAAGRPFVVLMEEWQLGRTMIRLRHILGARGMHRAGLLVMNFNNPMGFHRVPWLELNWAARLTTVSRFMKHTMWQWGVNPFVLPNGIAPSDFDPPDPALVPRVRAMREERMLLLKVARFDPDKRWLQAIEGMAQLKAQGEAPRLVLRGGMERHGQDVESAAQWAGLSIEHVTELPEHPVGDILWFDTRISPRILRVLYAESDLVLCQSGLEPFGLVGLEAMAQGAAVLVGTTGEDYAVARINSLVQESDEPAELAYHAREARSNRVLSRRLRAQARRTARRYAWSRIIHDEMGDLYRFFWEVK